MNVYKATDICFFKEGDDIKHKYLEDFKQMHERTVDDVELLPMLLVGGNIKKVRLTDKYSDVGVLEREVLELYVQKGEQTMLFAVEPFAEEEGYSVNGFCVADMTDALNRVDDRDILDEWEDMQNRVMKAKRT